MPPSRPSRSSTRLGVVPLRDLASTPQGVADGREWQLLTSAFVADRPAVAVDRRLHDRRPCRARARRRADPLDGGGRGPPARDGRRVRRARRRRRHRDAAGLRHVRDHRRLDRRDRLLPLAARIGARCARALRRRGARRLALPPAISTSSTPSMRLRSPSGSASPSGCRGYDACSFARFLRGGGFFFTTGFFGLGVLAGAVEAGDAGVRVPNCCDQSAAPE